MAEPCEDRRFFRPQGLSVCVLASGSKGNAICVSDGSASVLFDAGVSGKEIERRMRSSGLAPETLTAIVVSHEHGDHIQSVGTLSRRYDLPVYLTGGTLKAAASRIGRIADIRSFRCGTGFALGALAVHPFSLTHDAEDPAGFTVSRDGAKLGIATDLGVATTLVRTHLQGCSALILEANHDPQMLEAGPYPWPLKQRVRGRSGHLSNEESRSLLKSVLHDGLRCVVLAHLSQTNNTAEKAASVVGEALSTARVALVVADQNRSTGLLRI